MARARRSRIVAVALAALSLLVLTGEDWPTYLHDAQRTGASADSILNVNNVSQLRKLWTLKTGGAVAASATVVGGTAYVGSWDGNEYAVDALTGLIRWKTFLGITSGAPGCFPRAAGVSSAPAVQNGVVYLGGGDSYWYALDATTGAVRWRVFTGDNSAASGHYNWSSPLLYNGSAYVGVSSFGDCPLVQGQLLQVSLATHQVVNVFNAVPMGDIGGGIWTTPAVDPATNTIFVTTGTTSGFNEPMAQAMVALDATTLVVKGFWTVPPSQAGVDSDWGNSPILFTDTAGDALVGAINKGGWAYAFHRSNVSAGPIWSKKIVIGGTCAPCGDATVSSGAFGNGLLYFAGGNTTINGVGSPGFVRALDPSTGNYVWEHSTNAPVVPAIAYANGMVFDAAGPAFEVLSATTGARLYSFTTGGTLYGAPSLSNGKVFVGSTDTNEYAFALPATPVPVRPVDPNCPAVWTCQDIGAPLPHGSEAVAGGAWQVRAGGRGIGGVADQFRLMTEAISGDTQVSAQVSAQQVTSPAAQAGLIVRQRSDPGAPYFGLFRTPGNGVSVQYRTQFDGATTTVRGPAMALPTYLEIQRRGDQFQAATSQDGVTYRLIPGSNAWVVLPTSALVGLAVSSDLNGTPGTVAFNGVAITPPGPVPVPPSSPTACPAGWSCGDVGNPLRIGDQGLSAGTWTVQGAGTGIAPYTDQLHYVWQTEAGDASVIARVVTQTDTNAGAPAGIMLRQSTDQGSPFFSVIVTPGMGIQVLYRTTQGLRVERPAVAIAGSVPVYFQVQRSGNTFSVFTSTDGATWTYLPGSARSLFNGPMLAGIAVSSRNAGTAGIATFDTVSVTASAPPPPTACPIGWSCADIGFPTPAGEQTFTNGAWTVAAGGTDIWGISDSFRYIWQTLPGDVSASARVASQGNTDPFAKAGVMLRQSADLGASYYAALVTPGSGIVVQYRTAQGAFAAQAASVAGLVPAYLKVARSGGIFSAYTSGDGVSWTPVPGSSVALFAGPALAGMAVTSHNTNALSAVTLDTVAIANTAPPPAWTCFTVWSCAEIGNPSPPGSQILNGGTWTIQGGGSDIWLNSDQFHYVWQTLTADGTIAAHVTGQTNTAAWAKAGVMLRQSADPGAAYYFAFVTPANGIYVQYRPSQGASAATIASLAGAVPAYLEVARSGNIFCAYSSSDGLTWTYVPASCLTLTAVTGGVDAGMAVTSHDGLALSTVSMDSVSVTTAAPAPPSLCPIDWSCTEIGNPTPAGSQMLTGGSWTVQGGGNDIWGAVDQFHYVWQSLTTNGGIGARVASQGNTSAWAKAGVMLRQATDPGSAFYAAYLTPGNGIHIQYRPAPGANAVDLAGHGGTTPAFLKVTRADTTFSAYSSTDGVNWTAIAGSSITINMSGPLDAGLAVTSHNAGAVSTVAFDTLTLGP